METTQGLFDFSIFFPKGRTQMTKKGEENVRRLGSFLLRHGEGVGYVAGDRVVISNSILWQSSFIIFSRHSGVHKNIPPIFLESFSFEDT